MAFKINFTDEDSAGNASGAFCPRVWVNGSDPKKFVSGNMDLGVYATNGFDVANLVGLFDDIDGVFVPTAGGNLFEFVKSTSKLKAIVISSGAEVANGVDLAAIVSVPFFAWGR